MDGMKDIYLLKLALQGLKGKEYLSSPSNKWSVAITATAIYVLTGFDGNVYWKYS